MGICWRTELRHSCSDYNFQAESSVSSMHTVSWKWKETRPRDTLSKKINRSLTNWRTCEGGGWNGPARVLGRGNRRPVTPLPPCRPPQSAGTRLAHCQATTAAPRRVELRRGGVEPEIHSPHHIPFDSPGHPARGDPAVRPTLQGRSILRSAFLGRQATTGPARDPHPRRFLASA